MLAAAPIKICQPFRGMATPRDPAFAAYIEALHRKFFHVSQHHRRPSAVRVTLDNWEGCETKDYEWRAHKHKESDTSESGVVTLARLDDVLDGLRSLDVSLTGAEDSAKHRESPAGGLSGREAHECSAECLPLYSVAEEVVGKHAAGYRRKRAGKLCRAYAQLFRDQYRKTYWNGGEMAGCAHYARGCKLFAECCRVWVACRLCHDEAVGEDHEMDRHATRRLLCTRCMCEQGVGEQCVSCDALFARHYCGVCKFFEDTPNRQVYHCAKCGICRRGEGLGIDNFHCDKCDACVTMQSREHHRCVELGLHAECPICREFMFSSTTPAVYMRCGHSMHVTCFLRHARTSYRCPCCAKSLTDMTHYFERIGALLAPRSGDAAGETRPLALVLCNDCEKKSLVAPHLFYHKCAAGGGCASYNTRVLRTMDAAAEGRSEE